MKKPEYKQLEQYYARSRTEWRRWLESNHVTSPGVWLIVHKKNSAKPTVSYEEAVEEALCFGWIDSRPNKLDSERFLLLFSPRKPSSIWAKSNKQRVDNLIKQGIMTAAGMKAIETAKKDGSWNVLDMVDKMIVPGDVEKALADNKKAKDNFNAFSASIRKIILWWIESARRPETRAKRIEKLITSAEKNINPVQYIPQNKR